MILPENLPPMEEKKTTVGEESLKLLTQSIGEKGPDAIELQQEVHRGSNSKKSYEEEVWDTVDRGRNDPEIEGDFYVIVLVKKERHLKNVVRQFFFYRKSCPTPEFDQTVYKYHRKADEIEFIWTIPNNATCMFLPKMGSDLPDDQQLLLEMVNAFNKGDLYRKARALNKEEEPKFQMVK